MKKQYLFLILVIYLIGCIMNLCYYIVIYGTFFSSMEISRLSYSCVYKQFYTTERH